MDKTKWVGVLLLSLLGLGCSDRLQEMQAICAGTWELESRELSDGTVLKSPHIRGAMAWVPIDARKAHVSIFMEIAATHKEPRRFDYAASTYEISTSAITRARHVLQRQGYRASSQLPFASYTRAKKVKGKISVDDDSITIVHAIEGAQGGAMQKEEFSQTFQTDKMIASYSDHFKDTWRKVHAP